LKVDIPEVVAYELIVIDNNSSDNTASVVAEFMSEVNRNIRYVFEEKQGVSNARNKGFQEASGNIIACADDDIEFDCRWVIDILKAFKDNPDVSAVTGKVQPVFENGRPEWLLDDYLVVYGLQDYGDNPVALKYPIVPIEMNVAWRKNVIQTAGGYDARLGRDGKTLLSGEANILFYLLDRNNAKTIYIPCMKLYHIIPPARITVDWLVSRYYWSAISNIKSKQLITPFGIVELTMGLVREVGALLRALFGNNISVRKIYWHCRGIKGVKKIAIAWHLGAIRQFSVELFSSFLGGNKSLLPPR
jgi:glycosyltransferase involved in cell wall biosynthesis